jgi:hypothetical protein
MSLENNRTPLHSSNRLDRRTFLGTLGAGTGTLLSAQERGSALTLENERIALAMSPDGRQVTLADRVRGVEWRMDPARQSFRRKTGPAVLFPAGRVEREAGTLRATYALPDGLIRVSWELASDHVKVRLSVTDPGLEIVDMPGVFRPRESGAQLLLPVCQGVLYRGGDTPWEETFQGGVHCTLGMAATLAARGALLTTAEDTADWLCLAGEDRAGPFTTFQEQRCPAEGWYEREVRLYPVDAKITAVAKRYRARLKERGEFVSWEEKLRRKPILKNLFGALTAFIGYNKTSEVDYVADARKLRDYGFEHVLYYPVRMCNYSLDFLMGGDAPIWMSDDEISRFKAVPGALVAPWGWFIEGLDDGSARMARMYRRDPQGNPYDAWRIEQQQWKLVCVPYQVEEIRRRYSTDMSAMDWMHYDVNATQLGRDVCYSKEHELHDRKPLGKRGDVEWTRRLLGSEVNGNRIVSSEGFQDRYATSYDMGSTKLVPNCPHSRYVLVPLTMLVLHDSCMHDWWELTTYNATPGFSRHGIMRFGQSSSGFAARKAAMDALSGSAPKVFPFGRQYGWTDIATRRSFSFLIRLEDREVQEALKLAMPVAKLHKRVGMQELVSFELLSDDGWLQSSTFADGTRIAANLSDRPREAPGAGTLAPDTWVEVK